MNEQDIAKMSKMNEGVGDNPNAPYYGKIPPGGVKPWRVVKSSEDIPEFVEINLRYPPWIDIVNPVSKESFKQVMKRLVIRMPYVSELTPEVSKVLNDPGDVQGQVGFFVKKLGHQAFDQNGTEIPKNEWSSFIPLHLHMLDYELISWAFWDLQEEGNNFRFSPV